MLFSIIKSYLIKRLTKVKKLNIETEIFTMNKSKRIETVTPNYIDTHKPLPDERTCVEKIVDEINTRIQLKNAIRPKGQTIPLISDTPPLSVVMLIFVRENVALVVLGNESFTNKKRKLAEKPHRDLHIGIYQHGGLDKGVWNPTNDHERLFKTLVERYKADVTNSGKKEAFSPVQRGGAHCEQVKNN